MRERPIDGSRISAKRPSVGQRLLSGWFRRPAIWSACLLLVLSTTLWGSLIVGSRAESVNQIISSSRIAHHPSLDWINDRAWMHSSDSSFFAPGFLLSARTLSPAAPTFANTISGQVFTTGGLTGIGSGRTINLLQNGSLAGSGSTDALGNYSISGLTLVSGDQLAVYISGAAEKGATITLSGAVDIINLNIWQSSLIVRTDNGGTITNANLKAAGGLSPDADLTAVRGVDANNILTVPSNISLLIWLGSPYAPGADINDGGNWTNNGTFTAGTNAVTFNGSANQTISGSSSTTFNNLTIVNTGDPNIPSNIVSLDGSAGATSAQAANLTITSGVFDQGIDLASVDLFTNGIGQCVVVRPGATWRNRGSADETLSCDVLNEGTIEFNSKGKSCGDDDSIQIRSSVLGTQRTWIGSGTFSMTDVDVRDQKVPTPTLPPTLPLQILVNSGTDHPGTNTGWTFADTCTGPYTWIGGTGERWADDLNWSPVRPSANNNSTTDVLIFDGNVTPAPVVEDVQTQTNSAIRLQNGVALILHANIGGATLTLNGATGSDLDLPALSLLTLAGNQPLTIELTAPTIGGTVPAGHVAGQIIMIDDKHQLIGDNAGEIIFTGTNALTIGNSYPATAHPFGEGTSGSVIFQSPAVAVFGGGLDPLGGQGKSVVTFNEGSTAHFLATTAFLGDAGTYGNLIFDGNQGYTIAGSNPITILNNLEIDPGSTFLLSNSPGADLNLYGNFVDKTVIANGFSHNERVVKFLGVGTQTVSKAAAVVGFGGVLINQSPGGKVQLLSPTTIAGQLNLSNADSLLELNGQSLELLGTITGPGNLKGDLNASMVAGGVGALGTVNFVSGGQTLSGLQLNRLTNGSMTLGTNLTLAGTLKLDNGILNTGAPTLSLSPTSSVSRTNGYVIGNLQKSFGVSGNLGSFTFPLGTANAYSPLDANVTVNTNGALTAKAVQGQQPNIPGGANALQRYWTLSGSGITANLTFHYRGGAPTAGDVVGNEAIYKIIKYDGSFTQFTPDATGSNSASDHFATVNNISTFSDWTLAEPTVVNPGTVAFVGAPYTTAEGTSDHDVTITVARSGGTDGALDVTYATSNGTATAGSDYLSASGTLHWNNGETGNKTFPITVQGDTTYEANETVTITLSNATDGATISGTNPTTLTITNDDNPPATLVVNTTNDVDDGVCDATHCSLREAINAANVNSDPSTINFNIPNTDPGFDGAVYTIKPTGTALPTITQPVTIDGASQTTFNGDTNVNGPEIVINGTLLGGLNNGLVTANTAANSIIKELVVNGFGGTAIVAYGNNIQVLNNYLGTNASGTAAVANATGLGVGTSAGPTSSYTVTGNLISGNIGVGISGCDVTGGTFSTNKIGTDRAGVNNVGNGSHGFLAACTNFRDTTISNNTIAFNGGDGFQDAPEYVGATANNDHPNNHLTQNSIFENGGLGINLKEPPNGSADTVTPNDPGDPDDGGNHLQNFPVITVGTAGSTAVGGTLNTTPSTSGYVIEIFSNTACDGSGNGEGKTYLGSVTTGATDGSGNVNFTVTVPVLVAGQVLTATTTDASGNTSEFSACFNVTGAPTLSIGDATVTEGSSGGTTNANFTLTLSAPTAQDVIVSYSTQDGTATGGTDYVTITNGSATIPAGQTSGNITVTVNHDNVNEPNETFFVNISSLSPVTITDGQGLGTINDDDPIPAISINDVTQSEGDAGTTNFTFTVSLSNPSQGTITVDYTTANGTATAPSDYTAVTTPLTVTFNPLDTSKQITIQVNGDTLNEANETFFVNLSNNSPNSTILDGQGLGTINNDDPLPAITFPNSATQAEGNSGQTDLIIQVSLATASGQTASVDWATSADPGATHPATAGGTCTAGVDYLTSSGTVTFAPGVTSGSIHIPVCADTDVEFDETLRVTISNPVNASIPVGGDVCLTTIANDDTPSLSIVSTASQAEGNTGQANMPFAVTLSSSSPQTVTVHYATANGSTNPATGGLACGGSVDYVTTSGTLTFNPTETTQTINVPICGDTKVEPDETLTVTLDTPANATIAQATGTGTITNDDHAPVANAVSTYTPVSTLKTITLSATDDDGDAQTFSIVDSPQHGTLANFGAPSCSPGTCTETVDYTPTAAYTGSDSFTYKTNDGANDSNTATVSIEVFACPATFVVNSLGDESDAAPGDGHCDVDANTPGDQCTLRAALAEANALSTCGPIDIDATGVTGQINLDSALPAINHSVNITGAAGSLTVQRSTAPATPEFRIFTIGNVSVAISDVTISNGKVSDATFSTGGGILNQGSLTLTGVTVAGNSVGGDLIGQGGGIYNQGTLTLTNCTVSGNSVNADNETDGGGIYNNSGAPLTITDTTISGNSLSGPGAFGRGGGIYNRATLTVTNSTVSGNSVSQPNAIVFGGGIDSETTLTVINSTVSGNTASAPTASGGGIYIGNGSLSLTNCTVSNNSISGIDGGGINNNGASVTARNTIISGNTGASRPDYSGALTSQGHNLIGNTTGATVTPQPGDKFDASASPLNLGPLQNNGGPTQTMALLSGSVAIDAGDDCVVDAAHCSDPNLAQLTTDQRGAGFPRQSGLHVDIGAYEKAIAAPGTLQFSAANYDTPEGDSGTHTVTVTVTRTGGSDGTASVHYATSNGTATPDFDYDDIFGDFTWTDGDTTSRTFNVTIHGDTTFEANETINLTLSSASGASIAGTNPATITITNDDAAPTISIGNVSQAEGHVGTTNFIFTVSLSNPSQEAITVNWATAPGTTDPATARTTCGGDADYQDVSGTVTFNPGETSNNTSIQVPVCGDTAFEPDETFFVVLSTNSPNSTLLANTHGIGTITNDDPQPDTDISLSGGDLVITDANGGNTDDAITISFNDPNVRINDPSHVLDCGTGTTIDTHTCEFPLTSITSIHVNTMGGNDSLTLALAGGNFIPSGGLIYDGGTQTTGDQLFITGGNQGTVTYNYTNVHDGSIDMSNFGKVTYIGLEPISNTGTASDIIFELPAGPNTATLADDGATGNAMSRLSGATFETTDFANPTGSLTIKRGNAADTLAVNALPDFNANLTIGSAGNEFSTVTFNDAITLASNKSLAANASGPITLSNGSNALSTSGTGIISLTGANVTGAGNLSTGGGLTVSNTGSSSTLSGVIAGTGGLTKLEAGTLVLSGANTYTGATAVNLGRLDINGSIVSNTTVDGSATLGGTGTINSAKTLTVNDGVVAPGSSPGILNTGNVTFSSNSTFAVEIGGTTPGNTATSHDQLNVTGTVSLNDAVLSLSSFNGFTPTVDQTFVIINNDGGESITGTFDGLGEGATILNFLGSSSLAATITYQGGTNSNDVVLTVVPAPAPEIDVQGGSPLVSIADGDASPQAADGTDFGTITVGNSLSHTFTILNTGNAALNLTGTPKVNVTGTNAADFLVTAQPSSPVAASGSTTFTVHFTPSASGTRTATISIANDDTNENPYGFSIQGAGNNATCATTPTGMVSWWDGTGSAPTVNDIAGPNPGTLQGGAALGASKVGQGFTLDGSTAYINVPDNANLYPQDGSFTVDAWIKTSVVSATQQTIISHYECANGCAPTAHSLYDLYVVNGKLEGQIRDTNNNSQTLTGTTNIADGFFHHVALRRDVNGPNMTLYLDGAVEANAALTASGLIKDDDSEADPVTIGAIIATGGTPVQFFNGSIDEVEYFNRALTLTEIAAINDAGSAGKCPPAPEIDVQGNSQPIPDGSTPPAVSNDTDFGDATVSSNTTHTFRIYNLGSSKLDITAITRTGANPGDFSIGSLTPASPILSTGTATFTVTFAPSAGGPRTATIHIANNDSDEGDYDFEVGGNGLVINSPPTISSDGAQVTVNEGSTAGKSGTFDDADGRNTVTITATIGGNPVGTVTRDDPSGTWNWSYPTTDGPENSGTVVITADDGTSTATTQFSLVVNNVTPTIVLSGNNHVAESCSYTLNLESITDPGADTVSNYTIDWGDGSPQFNGSGSPANTSQTHGYAAGTYTITVSLQDEDGVHGGAGTKSVIVDAGQTTFVVNDTGDDPDASPGDTICETQPGNKVCTLRAAVEEANAYLNCPTTIDINFAFSAESIIVLPNGELSVQHNININGPTTYHLFIDGNGGHRAFVIRGANTVGISNVTIDDCVSATNGGAILNNGTLTLKGVLVTGNTAVNGGGIASLTNNSLALINTTISGNHATGNGGGIYNDTGSISTTNVTIAYNTANSDNTGTESGGGIFVASGNVGLHNTIVSDNLKGLSSGTTADDISGLVKAASSYNVIGAGSGGLTNGADHNQVGVISALLKPLQENGGPTQTHALTYDSPAVDKGDDCVVSGCLGNSPVVNTDQRNLPRPSDGDNNGSSIVDIGAYERQLAETRDVDSGAPSSVDVVDAIITFPCVTPCEELKNREGVKPEKAAIGPAGSTPAASLTSIDPDPLNSLTRPPNLVIGSSSSPPLPAFEVSTTAVYTPPATVCFYLPSMTDPVFFAGLRVLHREAGPNTIYGDSDDVMVDRTRSLNPTDFNTKLVCSEVDSFSAFAIAQTATPTAANASVSGQILDNNGAPVEGAAVRMAGTENRLSITDAGGNYHFDNVETNGFYVVTPSRANFSFSPAQRSFSQLGAHTDAVFTGTPSGTAINPLDATEYFVRQQYLDFLGREPDESGFNFWVNNIESCGSDLACREVKRVDTSAAYFLSIEFQQTGFLVYRAYEAAYGDLDSAPVPLTLREFTPDAQKISNGVVVLQSGWPQKLETNKQAFINEFVQRARFTAAYPTSMTPAQFVDKLFATAHVESTDADYPASLALFGAASDTSNVTTRAQVLRRLAENSSLTRRQLNHAFVLMEYFGYLRRDPNSGRDSDFSGYSFWLDKLNSFNGNFDSAEMVKAFLASDEYRGRFPR